MAACTGGGASRVEPASVSRYVHDIRCVVDEPDPAGLIAENTRPGALDLNCLQFLDEPGRLAYDLAATNSLEGALYRNRLANILIAQSDQICTVEKALMLERQAEVNGWLSIAATGLAGAAAIVTGDLASNILSGSAAFASSSRDHVNTHVYRNQIIQTITSAIDSKRAETLDEINGRLGQNAATYNVDAMVREVNAYHQLCSFGTGLQIVMESVERRREYQAGLRAARINEEIARLQWQYNATEDEDRQETILRQIDQFYAELALASTGVDLSEDNGLVRGDSIVETQ